MEAWREDTGALAMFLLDGLYDKGRRNESIKVVESPFSTSEFIVHIRSRIPSAGLDPIVVLKEFIMDAPGEAIIDLIDQMYDEAITDAETVTNNTTPDSHSDHIKAG